MKYQTTLLITCLLLITLGCKKDNSSEQTHSASPYSESYNLAKNNFEEGQFIEALQLIEEKLKNKNLAPKERIAFFVLKGLTQKKIKTKGAKALGSFQEAIDLAKSNPNLLTKEIGVAYHEYGTIMFRSDPDKAKEAWDTALDIKRRSFKNDDLEIAKTLNNLGIFHYQIDGDILKTEKYYNESIEIRKKNVGQEVSMGRLFSNLGAIKYKLQDFSRAKKYLLEGRELLKEYIINNPNDKKAIGQYNGIINNLGAVELDLGNLNEAKLNFENALKTGKSIKDKHLIFLGHLNLGRTARKAGNPDLALSHLDLAFSGIENIFPYDIDNPNRLYQEYALVYLQLKNNVPKAEYYIKKATNFFKEKGLESHPNRYDNYLDVGSILLDQGRLDLAESYFNQAAKNPLKDAVPSIIFSNLGIINSKKGNHEKAKSYFKQAISHEVKHFGEKSRTLGRIKNRYADFLFESGQHQEAIQEIESGIKIFLLSDKKQSSDIAEVNTIIDLLGRKIRFLNQLNTPNKESKISNLKEALVTSKTLNAIANNLESHLLNDEAKIELKEAITKSFEEAIATAFALYELNPTQEFAIEAFTLVANYKASILREKIRRSTFKGDDSELNVLLKKELSLLNERRFIKENKSKDLRLAEINIELDKLKKTIQEKFPSFSAIANKQKPLDVSAIKKSLKNSNTSLVEFFIGEETLYTFVFNKNGLNLKKKKLDADFNNNLSALLNKIENRPKFTSGDYSKTEVGDFVKKNQSISKEIITSISPLINESENLLIIPHGRLFYLPFELLIEKDFEYKNEGFADLPYLFVKKSIRYEYSSALINKTHSTKNTSLPYIGFAPDYSGSNFSTLDFNEKEISDIAPLFKGKTVLKKSATKESFINNTSDANIIHYAGHATIDEVNSDFSKLILSNNDELPSFELSNLSLNADLAVLTACETGKGNLKSGEGTMSFARSFKVAGCPNSVTSLWTANDACSPKFIFEFFKNLTDGQGKAKALNEARKSFLKKNTLDKRLMHPYYWSNFILIGDDEPVISGGGWSWSLWVMCGLILFVLLFYFFRVRK